MSECTGLKIGATAGTRLELRYRSIPDPDDWPFHPYSVVRTASHGQPKGYGFPSCTWTWEAIDQFALNIFLALFACNTDAGMLVYITTYTDVGRSQETGDYSAWMARPVDGEGKAMYPQSGGKVHQNVSIQFTHLEAG